MKEKKENYLSKLGILAILVFFLLFNHKVTSNEFHSRIEGIYEYVANYETGPKASTQTKGHRVRVVFEDGDYFLLWGNLKVKAKRVANGLIYEWDLGDAFGEGIYIFYENHRKLFGTFQLSDKEGLHTGTTQGKRVK